MELQPEREPELQRDLPLRGLQRPDTDAGAQKPEPHPPSPPQVRSSRSLLASLALLLVGSVYLWTGFDVKRESSVPAPGTPEYVADEIVVDLRDDITDGDIDALNTQFGIQLRYNSVHSARHKLMIAKVRPDQNGAIVAGLRASRLVEAADPNYVRHEFASTWKPNDPAYSQQWHLKMIGLEEAWTYTRGSGAVVAVLDTGVGSSDVRVWRKLKDFESTKFTKGYDFVTKDDIPEDIVGHGTHVAGTIAESTNNGLMGAGVAPDATIMPIRVLGGRGGTDADISDGLRYAADNGANVVNMSLGGPGAGSVFKLACEYAHSKNVALICAAGNEGRHGVSYPAKWPECIAVSAVNTDQKLAFYSNYGEEIDITGPGGELRGGAVGGIWQNTMRPQQTSMFQSPTMAEGFYALQGTSMAAPHIAGVAALLVSLGVREPDEIRSILRRSATSIGPDLQYGAGLVDASAAVKATGRSPYERYYGWAALATAAALLLLFTGRQNILMAVIFLVAGYYLPVAFERWVGFGKAINLVGHSVVLPVVWLLTPRLTSGSLTCASSLTLGLAVHFLMDIVSGASPFPVKTPSRVAFWYFLNLAIGAYLVMSAVVRMMPGKPKRKKQARPKAAYA